MALLPKTYDEALAVRRGSLLGLAEVGDAAGHRSLAPNWGVVNLGS